MSQDTGHAAIWRVLHESSQPLTYVQVREAVRRTKGFTDANIGSVLGRWHRAGLLIGHDGYSNRRYSVSSAWKGARMYNAKPRKLSSGEWGAVIEPSYSRHFAQYGTQAPNKGDVVMVTTKDRKVLGPMRIIDASPITKYGITQYLCTTEDIRGKDSSSSYAPKEKRAEVPKEIPTEVARAIIDKLPELVESYVAKHVAPVSIEVTLPDESKTKIDGAHFLFPRLLRLVAAGFNVFMHGPPGTGKTTAALQVAQALAREAEIDTLDPTTARSMVQGYMTPKGEPVHNVFTRCWERGSIYVADEVDLAPGHVQTLFNSALANAMAPLAWGNVARHDNFGFVATGNTAGRPTSAFPDRRPMSNAFADRLYFMHWPLDPTIETRAVGLPVPKLPEDDTETCDPQTWVIFVQCLRDWAKNHAPTLQVTPRASLLGIKALKLGESPTQVADALIFRGCDDELRAKALRNVRW